MAGRHTKLTPELIERACKVLRLGNYVKTTCGYLDISEEAWYTWIKDAEAAKQKEKNGIELTDFEKIKIEFSIAVKKAQDEAIVRNLQLIQTAAASNWQAAAWTLERRYPDMFSLAQRITITDKPEQLTVEDVKKRLMAKKGEQEDGSMNGSE